MKSRISIEVDFENNRESIIQIERETSSDTRDKLVSDFLQSLQHTSRWATITFVGSRDKFPDGSCDTWKITPLTPQQLESEIKLMQAVIDQYVKFDKQ